MAKRKKNNSSNNDLENIHIKLITKLTLMLYYKKIS